MTHRHRHRHTYIHTHTHLLNVRDDHGDKRNLEAVAVHKNLANVRALAKNGFQFLGGHKLALRKLENVLLAARIRNIWR